MSLGWRAGDRDEAAPVGVGHVAENDLEADQAEQQDRAQGGLRLDCAALGLKFGEFLLQLLHLLVRVLAQRVQRLLLLLLLSGLLGWLLGLLLGLGWGVG